MLLSHRKQFIFIHNYKVAGTSISKSLKQYDNYSFLNSTFSDKLNFLMGIYPRIYSQRFSGHISAVDLKRKIPDFIFNNYFKFGFVRDPWDWQVSLYTYMLQFKEHHQHRLIRLLKDFDEYIDWRVHNDLHLQREFFYDQDRCLMDFIGKMENLEKDFKKICKRLDIDVHLPHLNSSRKDNNYLKFYSKRSLDMVSQAYEEDVKLFNYSIPII